jgi:hypothetical protein
MKFKRVAAGAAALALPLAACGGEAEPVQASGAVVTRLEWVSFAHVEQTRTYTEFGYCDPDVLFPDDNGETDLRTNDCTVPADAYDLQREIKGEDNQNFWKFKIDDVTVYPTCTMQSRDIKTFDDDQATDRVPVAFCEDFDGRQNLPGAEIVYDDVNYYVHFTHSEGDTFVGASRSQWNQVPVGEPLEIVVTANYDLVCYAPLGSGDCLYD